MVPFAFPEGLEYNFSIVLQEPRLLPQAGESLMVAPKIWLILN